MHPQAPQQANRSLHCARRGRAQARRILKARYVSTSPQKFVFTDEHYVTTNDHTTRTMWVFEGEAPTAGVRMSRFIIPSAMIWAAIGHNYKGPIVFIPDGPVGMNADRYIRNCLSKVVDSLPGRIFQQDGARPHVAKRTTNYLRRKKIERIEDWPPYSADLNPIENLWPILDRRIAEKAPKTVEELKRATIEAWDEIPMSQINDLVASFKSKLAKIQ